MSQLGLVQASNENRGLRKVYSAETRKIWKTRAMTTWKM